MPEDLEAAFQDAVKGIRGATPLPYDDYASRLHNKVRQQFIRGWSMDQLGKYIDRRPTYPEGDPDPDNTKLGIFDTWDLFRNTAISAACSGIASVDDDLDKKKLKRYVSADDSVARSQEVMANFVGFCLGEHLNRELEARKTLTIDELFDIPGFPSYCREAVNKSSFILSEVRTDIQRNDHLFSIAWLLIVDYMQNRVTAYRNTPASGTDFKDKWSYQTLSQWSYTLWSNYGKGKPSEMDRIVTFCGRVSTIGLCLPDPKTGLQRPTNTATVMKAFYGMAASTFDDNEYRRDLQESLDRLKNKEDIINEWESYCMALTGAWEKQILPYWRTGMYHAFSAGEFDKIRSWQLTAYDDQPWEHHFPLLWFPRPPESGHSLGNEILPGTPIALCDGTSRPIEAIREGDKVLVQGKLGTAATLLQRPIPQTIERSIVRFNGESSRFHSSQVFHTTTGLRAFSPREAQKLNSYQRIGKLAVGHMLYRMEGNEYKTVEITSIDHVEEAPSQVAYALSLPEEHHTYHAHGYLVDTNTPTHTLKETVERLRGVPGNKRLALLAQCNELWGTFQTFDTQAINERLNWELFGRYGSPDGTAPDVGKYSRSLSYEDYLKTTESLSVSTGLAIDRRARGFSLSPHRPDQLPTGYQLPTLSLVDGFLIVQDEVQLRSKYDARKRRFQWTRELPERQIFEHGTVEINSEVNSGTGAIYLSSDSEPREVVARDQVHSFTAHGRKLDLLHPHKDPPSPEAGFVDGWNVLGSWKVTLDKSVWPDKTVRTKPVDPVDGGKLEDGFWRLEGVNTTSLQLPLIEELRDQINKKFKKQLQPFYSANSEIKNDYQAYSVEFTSAPLLPFISDAGPDVKTTFNVSVKDTTITLPTLFQEMSITLNTDQDEFTGYFFAYDPTKRGNRGNRHFIMGTLEEESAVKVLRSKISRAFESVSKPGETDLVSKLLRPAPVTENLGSFAEPSINDLQTFQGYQEAAIHNDTQLLIRNMMYYHMDEKQRDKILRQPKPRVPDDLPTSLADNLPGKLKTFFKEKYGPAFICRYVSRTQKYMKQFSDQEIKKLWYWWQGNGKNCLSMSEEYNEINRLTSREAMKRRYEKKLEPYMEYPDEWAKKLHDHLLKNTHLMSTWVATPIQNNQNVINKQCNILDALSPSKDWAKQFFEDFMAWAFRKFKEYPDIEDKDVQDKKYKWIYDSMHDMILAVLNDDDTISADVKKALMEDIDEFEKANNLNQKLSAEQRAANMIEKSAILIKELPKWLTYIGKGLQAAFSGTVLWKWAGEAMDNVVKNVAPKLKGAARLKGLGAISMISVSLAMAAVTVWQLVESWDLLSREQQGVVILEIARMVIDSVDKAVDAFKSFKSKPASDVADEINMQELSGNLSEKIQESGGKMGEVAEKIGGKEYRTAMADRLRGDSAPIQIDEEEAHNEDPEEVARDVPEAYEEAAGKYKICGNILRSLNAILGIGLVIAMSFSLAHDWNSMSDVGKVLGVLNIIVQSLVVLLDIIDAGVAVGLWAVTGTMSVALPILGGVLAVIGVVIMLVQLFINLFAKKQDPPDPISDFISDVAHKLIEGFDEAPNPKLTYTISKTELTAGQVTSITIRGENKTSAEVTVSHADITLYCGDDDVCIFRNGADDHKGDIVLVLDDDPKKGDDGHTYVTPKASVAAHLPKPSGTSIMSKYFEYDLKTAGPKNDKLAALGKLVLKQGAYFESVWTGMVNKKGDSTDSSMSWIDIVEYGSDHKCHSEFMLKRV